MNFSKEKMATLQSLKFGIYLFWMTNETYTIKGLDSCQYLEQGKCWWFATKSEDISSRPGSQAYNSYSDVVRTKRFTSITKKGEANNEDDA